MSKLIDLLRQNRVKDHIEYDNVTVEVELEEKNTFVNKQLCYFNAQFRRRGDEQILNLKQTFNSALKKVKHQY